MAFRDQRQEPRDENGQHKKRGSWLSPERGRGPVRNESPDGPAATAPRARKPHRPEGALGPRHAIERRHDGSPEKGETHQLAHVMARQPNKSSHEFHFET